MKRDSELWRTLRVGDRIRIAEIPPEFLQKGRGIHSSTMRGYKRLVARNWPLRIYKIDATGLPWVAFRFRRNDGRWEHHYLAVNHGGLVLVNPRRPEEAQTNYFCIIAHGKKFDADKFAKHSALKIDEIWHRADERGDTGSAIGFSGVRIDLGSGAELDVKEQQAIAVAFLRKNAASLKKLRSLPGVTTFYLGLRETVFPNSAGSLFDLSPELMKMALQLGIEVTVWACLSKKPFPGISKPK